MKITATLSLASIGSASAFVGPAAKPKCSPLYMSDDLEMTILADGSSVTRPRTPKKKRMSEALPFMECPAVLDGKMAGDVGFDPLGLAESPLDLVTYREAETKHGRLAMLAAAGWPLSELWDKKIAGMLGMQPVLDEMNRVPSVLNGGMGKISPVYWGLCLIIASGLDLYGLSRAGKPKIGYFPGNLGFDPLGLYPKDEAGQKKMQTKEIKNGRLAMVAITAFALQEFISGVAVVDQVPFLFHPITDTLFGVANEGYEIPPDVAYPAVDAAVEAASTSAADAFSAATMEAATVAPAVSAEAAVSVPPVEAADAISAIAEQAAPVIPPVDSVSAASLEAVTATPPIDAVAAAPTEAAAIASPADAVSAAAPVDESELLEAKKRVAELEAKLAAIGQLTD